jgi:hypothetical protein
MIIKREKKKEVHQLISYSIKRSRGGIIAYMNNETAPPL